MQKSLACHRYLVLETNYPDTNRKCFLAHYISIKIEGVILGYGIMGLPD